MLIIIMVVGFYAGWCAKGKIDTGNAAVILQCIKIVLSGVIILILLAIRFS